MWKVGEDLFLREACFSEGGLFLWGRIVFVGRFVLVMENCFCEGSLFLVREDCFGEG